MVTAQVVETSVTVNNNNPIQDYVHRDDQTQPTFKNFYVDDSLFSKPSMEQAVHSSLELMRMLRKGNFRLTKFISNYKDVLDAIPTGERTIKKLDLDKLPIERALGQQWNIDTDTFVVKTSPPSGRPGNDTRQRCLSTLSSIFDLLGMIGPVQLPAKRVLQKTW